MRGAAVTEKGLGPRCLIPAALPGGPRRRRRAVFGLGAQRFAPQRSGAAVLPQHPSITRTMPPSLFPTGHPSNSHQANGHSSRHLLKVWGNGGESQKVVQRWLQLAELAAPQSDHQLGLLLSEARQPWLYTGHRRQHFSPTRVSLSLRPQEAVQVTRSPAPPPEPPSHSLTRCQDVKMEADPKEPWWTSWGHNRSPRLRLRATPGSDLVGPSLLPCAAESATSRSQFFP
nr:uncharacterized protein LOC131767248 [Kogia breviceps]